MGSAQQITKQKPAEPKTILLVVAGGIAAYKSLELIRLLKTNTRNAYNIRCILTEGGAHFVTPLSLSALSENPVYDDLWSLKDEREMGHIRLSREADLIVIAPASANILAKMAHGIADDLATTCLLAADKPIMICPAMNHRMWNHPATQDNIQTLRARGALEVPPTEGDMACGEYGVGRMAEPEDITKTIDDFFAKTNNATTHSASNKNAPLAGTKALVTSGPTYEPIDPVRFIGNRSSGKQGHAIACALRDAGADVTLVTGPTQCEMPHNMTIIPVETAEQMRAASINALPADIAVFAAAVSDWSVTQQMRSKMKKKDTPPTLTLKENPDILAEISRHAKRPKLVIGFAAETHNLIKHAQDKLAKKGCDWIIANHVNSPIDSSVNSREDAPKTVFGSIKNQVYLIDEVQTEEWPLESKDDVALRLVQKITEHFSKNKAAKAA